MNRDIANEEAQDRREFFRVPMHTPLEFKNCSARTTQLNTPKMVHGSSRNISTSGILFHTEAKPPQVSSILWLNLDLRMLKICKEIEKRALTLKDGLLGRVVRVEEDAINNLYDIGVCFLTDDDRGSAEVQEILSKTV